jgi:hypothetical protein
MDKRVVPYKAKWYVNDNGKGKDKKLHVHHCVHLDMHQTLRDPRGAEKDWPKCDSCVIDLKFAS